MPRDSITVVIPVLNEAENLDVLIGRLRLVLDRCEIRWEIIFVDDGSTDDTLSLIKRFNIKDRRIKGLSLSRNFGQDIALAAGLKHSQGEAAILMDADLQHPPEVLDEFIANWREGYDVIYGRRIYERGATPRLRRFASHLYYRIFAAFSNTPLLQVEGMGDYWLLDRKAVDVLNRMGEGARFTKGLCSWIGFRSIGVPYRAGARATGKSASSYRRLARSALDGLTSFSTVPLRLSSLFGAIISLGAVGYAAIVAIETLIYGRDSPGFPSLIISIMILGGIQLISLGILGEYLGRVYQQAKGRPLYIVADGIGVDAGTARAPNSLKSDSNVARDTHTSVL
jgi:polyisoprenyl-phosphate glycosyltransferase